MKLGPMSGGTFRTRAANREIAFERNGGGSYADNASEYDVIAAGCRARAMMRHRHHAKISETSLCACSETSTHNAGAGVSLARR